MVDRVNQPIEKRGSPRVNWIDSEVQVVIRHLQAESQVLGWIEDISQGGFKVRAEIPPSFRGFFREWEEFHFETFENFFGLKGQGRIVWTSANEKTAGIKFVQLDEKSGRCLNGFLGILS